MVPYVQAGFAVLGFSLDGYSKLPGLSDERQLPISYAQFQKAQAGMVNVRNAVEFALQKIPQVDPQRLFIAGHSSAATLALLAAAHEPRLKGAVAFAPITDVEARLRELLNTPGVDRELPGVRHFARQSSPLSHVKRIACPVFLFHAADDSNAPVGDSRKFAELLKANGKPVDYVEVPSGNHYDSMIQQGIPRAIPWLKRLAEANAGAGQTAPANPVNLANQAVPPGVPLPALPFGNLPQNPGAARQPSGRAVTFRFQQFAGQGDSAAAAREALGNFPWVDLSDIEIDQAAGEIRIGQLGGSVNTEPARQALSNVGFQMLPGVSVGPKKPKQPAVAEPEKTAANPPSVPITDVAPTNLPSTDSTPAKAAPKKVPPVSTAPAKPREPGPARRVVTFRYERFSGKGASANAA
ncbi:MAG TPA: prolyl oligopeptidase family serine peptidase, partial [Planctomycetaceae bacterium]|nr:prolyl oligopeptidase family serine peptidase [Planctomycetaceae bacterium]